jgi:hypothetical protein
VSLSVRVERLVRGDAQGLANGLDETALFLDRGAHVGDQASPETGLDCILECFEQVPVANARRDHDEDYEPNVFIYDNYPGGIGLSEPLYRLHERLLRESLRLIEACPCVDGCPSCVGPVGEVGSRGKDVAIAILKAITGDSTLSDPSASHHS